MSSGPLITTQAISSAVSNILAQDGALNGPVNMFIVPSVSLHTAPLMQLAHNWTAFNSSAAPPLMLFSGVMDVAALEAMSGQHKRIPNVFSVQPYPLNDIKMLLQLLQSRGASTFVCVTDVAFPASMPICDYSYPQDLGYVIVTRLHVSSSLTDAAEYTAEYRAVAREIRSLQPDVVLVGVTSVRVSDFAAALHEEKANAGSCTKQYLPGTFQMRVAACFTKQLCRQCLFAGAITYYPNIFDPRLPSISQNMAYATGILSFVPELSPLDNIRLRDGDRCLHVRGNSAPTSAANFSAAYMKRTGRKPSIAAAVTYAAMEIAVATFQQMAPNFTLFDVHATYQSELFCTILGPLHFGPNHATITAPIVVQVDASGNTVSSLPFTELVYPMPTWEQRECLAERKCGKYGSCTKAGSCICTPLRTGEHCQIQVGVAVFSSLLLVLIGLTAFTLFRVHVARRARKEKQALARAKRDMDMATRVERIVNQRMLAHALHEMSNPVQVIRHTTLALLKWYRVMYSDAAGLGAAAMSVPPHHMLASASHATSAAPLSLPVQGAGMSSCSSKVEYEPMTTTFDSGCGGTSVRHTSSTAAVTFTEKNGIHPVCAPPLVPATHHVHVGLPSTTRASPNVLGNGSGDAQALHSGVAASGTPANCSNTCADSNGAGFLSLLRQLLSYTGRLTLLISDLRTTDLSLQAETRAPRVRTVVVADLMRDVVHRISSLFDVMVVVEMSSAVPEVVLCDPLRLRQLFVHTLGNMLRTAGVDSRVSDAMQSEEEEEAVEPASPRVDTPRTAQGAHGVTGAGAGAVQHLAGWKQASSVLRRSRARSAASRRRKQADGKMPSSYKPSRTQAGSEDIAGLSLYIKLGVSLPAMPSGGSTEVAVASATGTDTGTDTGTG
ncbi:hypothetical protein EON66_01470, partial [archaeon]